MGIIGNVIKAPFRAAKTGIAAPLNIAADAASGAKSGGFKLGKIGAIGTAVTMVALAPFTGGATLGVLPIVGGALLGATVGGGTGALFGGAVGAVKGAGESFGNLVRFNGKTGLERSEGPSEA